MIYKHAFRNAVIPVITIVGLQTGDLLAGAIIIENVFHLPGVGRLVFEAIGQRDLPVIQGVVLFIAMSIVIINFVTDLPMPISIRGFVMIRIQGKMNPPFPIFRCFSDLVILLWLNDL